MAEVRQYFCCTNNLTACKIVGGVQIALNVIYLIISVMAINAANALANAHANAYQNAYQHGYSYNHATTATALSFTTILVVVLFGGGILCGILLVVGASKRSATMLMVWIVLNGICVGSYFFLFIYSIARHMPPIEAFIRPLTIIGLGIWSELIAIGARQDVKKSGANIA